MYQLVTDARTDGQTALSEPKSHSSIAERDKSQWRQKKNEQKHNNNNNNNNVCFMERVKMLLRPVATKLALR